MSGQAAEKPDATTALTTSERPLNDYVFNAGTEETEFGLPPLPPGCCWRLGADTSRLAPHDLSAEGREPLLDNSTTYRVAARSSAMLLARKQESAVGGGSV